MRGVWGCAPMVTVRWHKAALFALCSFGSIQAFAARLVKQFLGAPARQFSATSVARGLPARREHSFFYSNK